MKYKCSIVFSIFTHCAFLLKLRKIIVLIVLQRIEIFILKKYVAANHCNLKEQEKNLEVVNLTADAIKSPPKPCNPDVPQNQKNSNEKYSPEECIPPLTKYIKIFLPDDSKWARRFWQLRCKCYKIVEHRIYETLLIFTILLSSIALVFEDINLNSQKRSSLKIVLYWADVFFCMFFTVEMLMKVKY